jgi:hypothetical protein
MAVDILTVFGLLAVDVTRQVEVELVRSISSTGTMRA